MIQSPRVIFQDSELLVIEKPAGWVVNRSQTTSHQQTIQDWLENESASRRIASSSDFSKRSGIVHRLDKETSGLLLVAKNEKSFFNLQSQFKNHQVKKKYLVLLHGHLIPEEGRIEASISRNPFDRHKFGVFLAGRRAVTNYRVKRYFSSSLGNFSLVEVEPQTGRTHQIRVHFKYRGYPVVSDVFYAGRKTARLDRHWCPRQFLHAAYLEFIQPGFHKRLVFKSPLPIDLQQALNFIK